MPSEREAMHFYEERANEVHVHLESRSLRGLFIEAGLALAEAMLGSKDLPTPSPDYERIALQAPNREALLAAWVNQLIHLSVRDAKVFTTFTIELLNERELVAGVQGSALSTRRTLVREAMAARSEPVDTGAGFVSTLMLEL